MFAIDYLQLNFLPPLVRDYLRNEEQLRPLFQYPFDFSAFGQVIKERKFSRETRKIVSQVLLKQYGKFPANEHVLESINKLQEENTFTVATAHQPVLFTGPLYFIYKIISAIRLAEELKKTFPENHFVPVYFMGAEDHDFEEINHCYVNGKKIEWQQERRGAVGRIATHAIAPLIEQAGLKLQGAFAEQAVQLLKDAYLAHATLADATAHVVNSLFGEYGLVVLNPDDKQLKEIFAPAIKEELLHQRAFKLSEYPIQRLSSLGYAIQANPREINLFYLHESSRERIVFDEVAQQYRVLNTTHTFTQNEILNEVSAHPERFSPNVFLRPLYQEILLPNLAYIGGAGELSYWLEQKTIFDHFGINFPMLVLRNSAMLIDSGTQKKKEKTGLEWQEFFEEEETLVKNFVKKTSTNALDISSEKEKVNDIFAGIREKAIAVDTTLAGAVEAQKAAVLNGLDGLEKKILKAEKRNFETATAQVRAVKLKLFPHNNLQERVENFLPSYAESGRDFIASLLEAFDPFKKEMLLLFRQ